MLHPFDWLQQLYTLLESAKQVSPFAYGLVFLGGVVSALSPCYTPVLAMFAGYVAGHAKSSGLAGLRISAPFIAGNALTLGIVGLGATVVGRSVLSVFTHYQLDRWIPGVIGLVMGLQLLGLVRLKLPAAGTSMLSARGPQTGWQAFLLGLPFGLVVTPCTIPIFVSVVTFVAFAGSIGVGFALMVVYAVGRGVILSLVGLSAASFKAFRAGATSHLIERVSGAVILAVSLGLLVFYRTYLQLTMQWMTPR